MRIFISCVGATTLAATTAVSVFLPTTTVRAQAAIHSMEFGPKAAEADKVPVEKWTKKTADGQPDLEGVWFLRFIAIYDYDIEAPAPERAYPGKGEMLKKAFKPAIVEPADGIIPYQPWARKKRQELYEAAFGPNNLQEMDPQALCIPHAPPRMFYHYPVRIIQQKTNVVMLTEFTHMYRVIPMDGRPHLPEQVKLFTGDSRGRWDGDSLVIDVKNNNGRNWLSVAGDFHSDKYTVEERLTRIAADQLRYEVTITDPVVYTKPWKMRFNLIPAPPDMQDMLEQACYEGNGNFDFAKLGEEEGSTKDAPSSTP